MDFAAAIAVETTTVAVAVTTIVAATTVAVETTAAASRKRVPKKRCAFGHIAFYYNCSICYIHIIHGKS